MSILLIRHAQTASNAARVVQMPDTPLSEDGLAQARRLAQRLVGLGVISMLASDYARAAMTARCIEEATGVAPEFEPLLQERNFGDHRGTPYAKLPTDIFAPGYAPPGGESWPAFHRRVDRGWERIQHFAAAHGRNSGNTVVVTHGLVCHSILARHVRLPDSFAPPPHDGPPLHFENTALTVLSGPGPWKVERLACVAHLEGLTGPASPVA